VSSGDRPLPTTFLPSDTPAKLTQSGRSLHAALGHIPINRIPKQLEF